MFGAQHKNQYIMPQNDIQGSYNSCLQNANNSVTYIINIFSNKKLKQLQRKLKLKHKAETFGSSRNSSAL